MDEANSKQESRPGESTAEAGSKVLHRPGRVLERLNAADWRVLLLWLLAGLVGAGVAYRYFFRAFPEAAVDFKVTRGAALNDARDFASAQGAALQGYKSSIVFNVDDDQKTYLERELGLEQANRVMSSSDVAVWYWDARFFRPLQKEEFDVRVDPGGRIVGYSHVIADAVAGERLGQEAALAKAQDFLVNTLHAPLDNYAFLPEEANSTARPNRTDWSFTWERKNFLAKDAPYRLSVGLQGDRIGSYAEFLKVPEEWQRSYSRLRSSNDFIEIIAIIPYALLLGAALSVLITLARGGQVRWGGPLKLGLFIAGLYFLMTANQFPLAKSMYDTNGAYSSFWLGQVGAALANSVALALLVVIAYIPGEPLYRIGQPDRLQVGKAFTIPGLRTKQFFVSLVIGVCLAGAHIGYVVLFYVTGRHFGVWAPQDLQYSDTMSTALPWLFPLTIGVYAAASEEFLFRMFSVRFLLRATGSTFLAVVVSAFSWGFLHSNYPQEPPYIRGIEVGLMGIVAGLVMLRWGILATLTWHYSVDAFLTGLSLIRSGDLYSRISGSVVGFGAFIPLAIAGALYLARGGFAPADDLLNRAAPMVQPVMAPAKPVEARTAGRYAPLGTTALAVLAICGVVGAVLLATVHPPGIGNFVRFSIDAKQADALADQVLRQRGVDPGKYRRDPTVQYTFDGEVNEYLRREIGIQGADRVYRNQVPSAFWSVRYFQDSQPEEYVVVLLPNGGLHSVHHVLAETAAGANLSKEEAQNLAAAYLTKEKGLDLSKWRLIEANSEKLPARTDHDFVWEQTASLVPASAGEGAHVRVTLQVLGREVSGYRIRVHVPEDWMRNHEETTLANTIQSIGQTALLAAFVIFVLVVFFRSLGKPEAAAVPWRPMARGLLIVFAAAVIAFAMGAPQYLMGYMSDQPFSIFVWTRIIGLSLGSLLIYSLTVLGFGLAALFFVRAYGIGNLPGWRGMPGRYYRDMFFVGLCGSATVAALPRVGDWISQHLPVLRYGTDVSGPQMLDANWPALAALASAVLRGFLLTGVAALVLGFAACYLRRAWMQALLLVVAALLLVPRWGSAGDFALSALLTLAALTIIWLGATRLMRLNLLAGVLLVMLLSLAAEASDFLRQTNGYFRANGWVLVAAIAVLLCWPLAAWLRGAAAGSERPAEVSGT